MYHLTELQKQASVSEKEQQGTLRQEDTKLPNKGTLTSPPIGYWVSAALLSRELG